MAAIVVARGGTRMVKGRRFFPHILIYLECKKNTLSKHYIRYIILYRLPSRAILNLLQEIKDDLKRKETLN